MEEIVLEISSDSNDTILPNKGLENEIPELYQDADLDYLYKKYVGDKRNNRDEKIIGNKKTQNITENLSLDGDESKKYNYFESESNQTQSENEQDNKHKVSSCSKTANENDQMNIFSLNTDENAYEMSMKSIRNTSKEQQKLEKEKLRVEKQKMREQKREEEQRNKAIKKALANHYKNMKPENCIKFIKVQIDKTLACEEFSKHVISELQTNGVSHVIVPQNIPWMITWKTQLDSHILNVDGQVGSSIRSDKKKSFEKIDTSNGTKIEEVLLIMKWNDFLVHVHNETFNAYIENVYMTLEKRKLIVAIYGLGKYYQYQKRNKNREFKEDISNKATNNTKDQRIYGNIPSVSRRTVEYALTEIQLLYSISHKMVETEQELATFVFQVTKSIAQAPYKKQKEEQFIQSSLYTSEDNRDCISVDKNGNGLSRLWKQILTTFPLASLETAEAIAAVYPTPLCLMKAYDDASNTKEGETLLQDIPIRRAAGPISSMRRIGPELSRKMYYFFTSVDPDKLLM